jgi:hypothetical protein
MKIHFKYRRIVTLGFVLLLAGALSAQRSPDKQLLVYGKSTSAVVLQLDGHSYIDIRNPGPDYQRIGEIRAESDRTDNS